MACRVCKLRYVSPRSSWQGPGAQIPQRWCWRHWMQLPRRSQPHRRVLKRFQKASDAVYRVAQTSKTLDSQLGRQNLLLRLF